MDNVLFKDTRIIQDFKTTTFSGYDKKQVIAELKKKILECRVETAVTLAFELLACGDINKIYTILDWVIFRKIGIQNPVLPYRYFRRFKQFLQIRKQIINNLKETGKKDTKHEIEKQAELELRNSTRIRNQIAELITILCHSGKKNTKTAIKCKSEDFHTNKIKEMTKSGDNNYVHSIIRLGDSPETRMACNEIMWGIIQKNETHARYWISWLFQWDAYLLSNGVKLECASRNHIMDSIDNKDISWLLWDMLLANANKLDERIQLNIHAIFNIYKYKWSTNNKKSRIHYILLVVDYLTKLYSIGKGIIADSSQYIKQAAYYYPIIIKMKKKEVIDIGKTMYKVDLKHKRPLIPNNELELTEKQRNRLRRKIKVKKSEEKLLTVYKLDSQI
jgi:hypothetical protein